MLNCSIKCSWFHAFIGLLLVRYIAGGCPFPEWNVKNGAFMYEQFEDIYKKVAPNNYILQFRCFTGYKIVGWSKISCLNDKWSGSVPTCARKECSDPPKIVNGKYKRHFSVDEPIIVVSYAIYSCNVGYELENPTENKLDCVLNKTTGNTNWRGEIPVCKEQACFDPPAIKNGQYEIRSVVNKHPTIGSLATYSCNDGYELVNTTESILSCVWNETTSIITWKGKIPVCKEKECPDPGESKNGQRNGSCCSRGDVLQFSCAENYELVGEKEITCLPSGSWNSGRPLCKPPGEHCDLPAAIPHGIVTGMKEGDYFQPYDEAQILCEPGYAYKGPAQFVLCEEGGFWEEEFGECTEVLCNSPDLIANGTIPELLSTSLTSFPLNFEITYSCDVGFRLVGGSSKRFCGQRGWSGKTPYCEEIHCPNPRSPEYGSAHGNSFKIGDKVSFRCFTGYQLLGSFERYCLPNGQWNGELARCDTESNYCPDPGVPINGFKNSANYDEGANVRFGCQPGYILVGSEIRTCLRNRTWSGTETKCLDPFDFDNKAQVRDILKTSITQKAEEQGKELQNYHDAFFKIFEESPQNAAFLDINPPSRLILYFVFDASHSVGLHNFRKSVEFAKAIVKNVDISENGARAGALIFSTTAAIQFLPVSFKTNGEVLDALDKLNYTAPGIWTNSALSLVREELIPLTQGAFGKRSTKHVVFILSDGRPNLIKNSKEDSKELKKNGVEIYCIGVTGDINKKSLYEIATDSEDEPHVFMLENYSTLEWLSQELIDYAIDYSQCGLGLEEINRQIEGERMIDGIPILESWPWMASIYSLTHSASKPAYEELQCEGSIIHERFILTSAHCLHTDDYLVRRAKGISVKLGFQNMKHQNNLQNYAVENVFPHNNYNAGDIQDYDIAIIQLSKPIEFNPDIRPVCLPPTEISEDSTLYNPNEFAVAEVWVDNKVLIGKERIPTSTTKHLKELLLAIESTERCRESLVDKGNNMSVFTDRMFCAGDGLGDSGLLVGDSGGSLIQSQMNSEGYLYWTLVGIGCGLPDTYAFYTNVKELRPWIDETINNAMKNIA